MVIHFRSTPLTRSDLKDVKAAAMPLQVSKKFWDVKKCIRAYWSFEKYLDFMSDFKFHQFCQLNHSSGRARMARVLSRRR